MDWTNPGVSELAKEEKAEMSSLVFGFVRRMSEQLALRG